MGIITNWKEVKNLFEKSLESSFHCALATVTEKGEPHVAPIGSLILGKPGHGFYFEKFPQQLPRNLESNKKVCVLAVNSSKWFWLKSLINGKFTSPSAVRLYGIVGDLRKATDTEIELWKKRVKIVSFSKGHAILWRDMSMVRDIEFTRIEPVHTGKMSCDTWSTQSAVGQT